MPLLSANINHPRAAELESINRILDENPIINEMVLQEAWNLSRRYVPK